VHGDPQLDLAEGKPAIVLYDQAPGGIGLSQRLYELHDELLARAIELVSTCVCNDAVHRASDREVKDWPSTGWR